MIELYTDGSAKANGKENSRGGFGVAVLVEDSDRESGYRIEHTISEQCENVTNNQMELKAIITALKMTQTRYKYSNCVIKSDSAYCVNMINEWIYQWFRNGWTRYKGQPIENLDLVKQIWEYLKIDFCNFSIEKVPGHSNLLGNELADALATNNKEKVDKILKENGDYPDF